MPNEEIRRLRLGFGKKEKQTSGSSGTVDLHIKEGFSRRRGVEQTNNLGSR